MTRLTILVVTICIWTSSSMAHAQLFRCAKARRCPAVCEDSTAYCVSSPTYRQLSDASVIVADDPATSDAANSEQDNASRQLLGTWVLKESKTPGSPSGIGSRLKMFTETHWCVIQPDLESGEIVFQHGGTYEFDGTELHETILFAGDRTSSLIGRTFTHKLEISDDVMKQIDADDVYNEMWHKAKAQDPQE